MRELGRILRTKREAIGYDLDEIEEKTKIRKRYLIALEEGDWSSLPGRVYARGFVRSYADVLGLDGFDLLQKYVDGRDLDEPDKHEQAPVETPVRRQPVATPPPPKANVEEEARTSPQKPTAEIAERDKSSSAQPKKRTPQYRETKERMRVGGAVGQVLIIVAALVVVGGGYVVLHRHMDGRKPTQAATSGNQTGQNNTTAPANTTQNKPTNQTGNHTTKHTTTTKKPPKQPVTITAQPFTGGAHPYLVGNVQKLHVVVQVTSGQCWMAVTGDGGKVLNGNDIVNPGQSQTFDANQTIEFNLGHVQGVTITVNGKPLTLPDTNTPVTIQIQRQSS